MKLNAFIRSLLLGAALSTGSLFANSIVLNSTGYNGGLNGGEFTANTSNDGTFVTFCIEHGVFVTLGTTYNYTISPIAQSGGTDLHSPGAGDPVSAGTAWLYTQFYLGTLVGAAGSGNYFDGATHNFNAGVLQKAFWDLEDEQTDAGNYYVGLAIAHFGGAAATYADAAPGSSVQALNLWTADGSDVQSQLIIVPDSGMTLALLGIGLLSLVGFRRKL